MCVYSVSVLASEPEGEEARAQELAAAAKSRAEAATPSIKVPAPSAQIQRQAQQSATRADQRGKESKVTVKLPTQAQDQEKLRALVEQAQAHTAAESRRVAKDVFGQKDPSPPTRAALPGTLVVALSSSMPERMIRDYLMQLDGVKGSVVVFRGFIGGAQQVKPTGVYIERIARRDLNDRNRGYYIVDMKVDPLVFRDLHITQVPAVAYRPTVSELKHCDAETLSAAVVVYGASSVSSSLRELKRRGVDVPEQVIRQMEGST